MNKTLLIFAHPYFEYSKANIKLFEAYQSIENVTFWDLYEEDPDFNVTAFKERNREKD